MNEQEPYPSADATTMHMAIDLQDQMLCAGTELDRLQRLLSDAVHTLMQCFGEADATLRSMLLLGAQDAGSQAERARHVIATLGSAVKALQFQDMASQLIAYTQQRVGHCADRLASGALSGVEDAESVVQAAPDRPNPVIQDEMDSGLVELF